MVGTRLQGMQSPDGSLKVQTYPVVAEARLVLRQNPLQHETAGYEQHQVEAEPFQVVAPSQEAGVGPSQEVEPFLEVEPCQEERPQDTGHLLHHLGDASYLVVAAQPPSLAEDPWLLFPIVVLEGTRSVIEHTALSCFRWIVARWSASLQLINRKLY